MKKQILLGICVFCCVFVFAQMSFAQGVPGTLTGRVTDSVSGRGIGTALVKVSNTGSCPFGNEITTTRTNGFGYYAAPIHTECGVIVEVSAKGYYGAAVYYNSHDDPNVQDFSLVRNSGSSREPDESQDKRK